MPELPNRDNLDAKLAALLLLEFNSQRERIMALLGDPPDARRVPAAYWSRLSIGLHAKLLPELEDVYLTAARQQADDLDTPINESEAHAAATIWALDKVNTVVSLFIDNTRQQTSDKLKAYYDQQAADEEKKAALMAALLLLLDDDKKKKPPAETPDELAERLRSERREQLDDAFEKIFGKSRAESVAVTTITQAGYAGERHYNEDQYYEQTGVRLIAYWAIEPNPPPGHPVCPICYPINGLPESQWPVYAKAGPGSVHPHCRCFGVYRVVSGSPQ